MALLSHILADPFFKGFRLPYAHCANSLNCGTIIA
jgi:hypothetical protein